MKGRSTLLLNEAPLQLAIQRYLESERKADAVPLRVLTVLQKHEHPARVFEVEVEYGVMSETPALVPFT